MIRVYVPRKNYRHVAHVLIDGELFTRCGRVSSIRWYGIDDPIEAYRARKMPLCKKCEART